MQPLDFLQTAEYLWRTGAGEADWRSSISRSYYALYWMISDQMLKDIPRILLQSASLCRKDHIVHERLQLMLRGSGDDKIKSFGEHLNGLRLARIDADYQLCKLISKARAEREFGNATALRDELHVYGVPKLVKAIWQELEETYGRQAGGGRHGQASLPGTSGPVY